jgi:hypothetical protein
MQRLRGKLARRGLGYVLRWPRATRPPGRYCPSAELVRAACRALAAAAAGPNAKGPLVWLGLHRGRRSRGQRRGPPALTAHPACSSGAGSATASWPSTAPTLGAVHGVIL